MHIIECIAYLERSTSNGSEQADFFPIELLYLKRDGGKSCQTKEVEMKSKNCYDESGNRESDFFNRVLPPVFVLLTRVQTAPMR